MQFTQYHPQFFTATNLNWKHLLKEDKYKDIVLDSLRFMVSRNRVKIYSFVIMPNHLHLIWQVLPGHEQQDVQRDFLKYTAQQIRFDRQINHREWLKEFEVNAKGRKYQFWERNPLSIELYTEAVFLQKENYIHNNPVQEKWNYPLHRKRIIILPHCFIRQVSTTGVSSVIGVTKFKLLVKTPTTADKTPTTAAKMEIILFTGSESLFFRIILSDRYRQLGFPQSLASLNSSCW